MKIVLTVVALGAFLAGCGSASHPATKVTVTPSVAPSPGIQTFVADVRRDGINGRDMNRTTDDQLATIGESACQALSASDYGTTVQTVTRAGASAVQADELVRSAVRNLCPQYRSMLP